MPAAPVNGLRLTSDFDAPMAAVVDEADVDFDFFWRVFDAAAMSVDSPWSPAGADRYFARYAARLVMLVTRSMDVDTASEATWRSGAVEDLEGEEYLTRIANVSFDGLGGVNSDAARGFTQFIAPPDRRAVFCLQHHQAQSAESDTISRV
jgi:hypothetical protein